MVDVFDKLTFWKFAISHDHFLTITYIKGAYDCNP